MKEKCLPKKNAPFKLIRTEEIFLEEKPFFE
jgi:hypothetical protein